MQHDFIEITGAREHNLKGVSLRVPKRAITVFTGVSGSGKSSLVFGTIAAESQRQLNETFSAFARNRLPRHGRPDADAIANLSTAIVVDQKRLGGNSRSTVGTITDIYALLRLLYSRVGTPFVGFSNVFSFNDPQGMCPECHGLGRIDVLDLDAFFDLDLSLNDGALRYPDFRVGTYYWGYYVNSGHFDNDKPLRDYTGDEWHMLLYGSDGKVGFDTAYGKLYSDYEGAVDRFTRLYIRKGAEDMSERGRAAYLSFVVSGRCGACGGTRLNPEVLGCTIDGRNIAELAAMEAVDLVEVLRGIDAPVGATVLAELIERIEHLIGIGLGYLSLDRRTATLSGGESQRIKMVRHLGSSLTDVMYIFDEPSIGLHARDVRRLNTLLRELRDKGNTVLVVEHDPDVIEIADHVVDLGPRAGADGGEIVYEGGLAGLAAADTLTARHLRTGVRLKERVRRPTGRLKITGAATHNLRDVSVAVPTGVLTAVTGVAGSGKSTLINEHFLVENPEAVVIDQSAIGTSRRSNPATYTGAMDDIRRLFAKANGVSASLFSANSKGACEACNGLGVIYTELAFMAPMTSTCEVCQGRRFKSGVLAHTVRGRTISDVLAMPVAEAAAFFTEPGIAAVLGSLEAVGLGYLTLGQPVSTLSGGECQRIKLAGELRKSAATYVLDEPTTGLHMSDVAHLLRILERLVDGGGTVVVIEHDLDVVKSADWVIDLGPEGGRDGGAVVFEGTPGEMAASGDSHTARHLREDVRRSG
ncbi:excinuclease ABC A subunit [Murinocardiopsis flavida]|uniref:UvrABC system protein A n=1 Tax=Murinocardiopsis flavida TaxID=645275 RepID=A0A2P8DGC2_9ACTN|nr:excinuclease ABC subunit UvrA [Murinocardiopsis flavida]PSK96267.1 excinuclease ABC A subunit [Murinocardiopsis flavida]